MELNAEQSIKELDTQLKFAKFTKSKGVLISAKCAQFCLEHAQFYEQKIKELTEENERLKLDVEVCGAELSRYTENIVQMAKQDRADTVQKMQSEIEKRCIKGGIYPAFVASTIDQIAKEMLEGASKENAETCVNCGAVIPEGRQICPNCNQ
jgi:hypothetical protein